MSAGVCEGVEGEWGRDDDGVNGGSRILIFISQWSDSGVTKPMILATTETVEYIGTFLKLRGVRKVESDQREKDRVDFSTHWLWLLEGCWNCLAGVSFFL